jgi:flavin reductase (DIM6/NTAB) family NADH-FMN oxidoreductase RutF
VGPTGAPLLLDVQAYLECKVVGTQKKGDHTVIIGEVVDAFADLEDEVRPDESILMLSDLEGDIFYGG